MPDTGSGNPHWPATYARKARFAWLMTSCQSGGYDSSVREDESVLVRSGCFLRAGRGVGEECANVGGLGGWFRLRVRCRVGEECIKVGGLGGRFRL
jgi:hypothetical protein